MTPGKTRSSSPVQCSRCESRASALGGRGRQWHRAHAAALRRRQRAGRVARGHADVLAREVDVAPAQRDELALAQSGERGQEEQRAVLLVVGVPHEREDLVGREHVDAARRRRRARAVDVAHRVGVELPDAARTLHEPVEDDDDLLLGAVGQRTIAPELARPALDELRRDVLQAPSAERRQQVVAHDRPRIADGARLALAVVLEEAQVLGAGVVERRAGAHGPGQRARARPDEHGVEPLLREATGVEAGRRPAASRPRRPDLAVHLAPVAEAVLGPPDRPASAFMAVHVA